MRFTRDFILLLALCVGVAGIGASSLWLQKIASHAGQDGAVVLNPGSTQEVAAEQEIDRRSLIASLRALLPERKAATPVVEETPVESSASATSTETTEDIVREVKWCDATIMDAAFAAAWPTSVEVVVEEGARIIRVPAVAVDPLATATPPQAVMQLPLYPSTGGEHCLTHSYVGVTPSGRLIHNNDVILYSATDASTVIGYAFDGHPIMGADANATFDACGGSVSGSYAYRVRPDESFILSCFAGVPSEATLTP